MDDEVTEQLSLSAQQQSHQVLKQAICSSVFLIQTLPLIELLCSHMNIHISVKEYAHL